MCRHVESINGVTMPFSRGCSFYTLDTEGKVRFCYYLDNYHTVYMAHHQVSPLSFALLQCLMLHCIVYMSSRYLMAGHNFLTLKNHMYCLIPHFHQIVQARDLVESPVKPGSLT
jgi:hypothetical protein